METLANLAKQNSAAAPPQNATPPTLSGPFGQQNANTGLPPHLMNQRPPYAAQPLPAAAPVSSQPLPYQMPLAPQQRQQPLPYSMPFASPAAVPTAPPSNNQLPPALAGLAGLISAASQQHPPPMQQQQPPPPQPQAPAPNVQQNLVLIQTLLSQGLSLEQITAILAQVGGGNVGAIPGATAPPSLVPSAIAAAAAAAAGGGAALASQWPPNGGADWNKNNAGPGYPGDGYGGRSPHGHNGRGRSRSRSPRRWDGHESPPRGGRRTSPGGRDRGRGREYRQRSPPGGGNGGRHGGNSPQDGSDGDLPAPGPGEKWVEHDPTLPPGTIRVLSRTLFVGGVTISESELRGIFARFGDVQTCIVNKEKRHAFIKMYTRRDAEAAKIGMEQGNRSDDTGLRTRWGVGFGPRDCSDYSKGVSIIPIAKLTEADRKWLLTAAWGGSGGQPIATGLVVEEPDIEIGAGVSSKAISRRMQTDRGGANGPRSTRREEELANANAVPINPHGPGAGGRRGGGRGRNGGGSGVAGVGRGGGGGDGAGDELNYSESSSGDNNGSANGGFPYGLAMGANGMPAFASGYTFPAP